MPDDNVHSHDLVKALVAIARLEADNINMKKDLDELKHSNQQLLAGMTKMQETLTATLARADGGWKVLLVSISIAAGLGGFVSWVLGIIKGS